MADNNPMASYIEAQMTGTAGIVQAAVQGMQRVQEIMLRAMREGAGGQLAMARSVSQVRDASDLSRMGENHAVPAAEQFTRYQQELISAVTEMNTGMIQASYSMMERVGQALSTSTSAMGLPQGGQAAGPMAAYQAGMRQWQSAMESLTQAGAGVRSAQDYEAVEDEEDEEEEEVEEPRERPARKAGAKRSGRR